ncbi:hypothetical protein P3S38_29115, partial [Enterobacter hormaechei]|uniref:hypothetical protein n=1 Tax=Enterobacter hormaechei TaxID=158836 RepID=UPI0023E3588C
MKLAYWMYAGPAHIGTLRVASSFKNVHAIMHAPLGDDYFNVMRSMLERERDFTAATASIVDRSSPPYIYRRCFSCIFSPP